MTDTGLIMDIFLQPGDFYFGDSETRIRTLLGSCVAITLWHPSRHIGGMTHCLLPGTGRVVSADGYDGRYVDEALPWLLREAVRNGTRPAEYQFKLFGGGDMFAKSGTSNDMGIGRKNALRAIDLLSGMGLSVLTHDIGGTTSRSLIFDVSTGDVWVRRGLSEDTPVQPMALSA